MYICPSQKKFLVPADLTIGQFMYVIRKVKQAWHTQQQQKRRRRSRRVTLWHALPQQRLPHLFSLPA